MHCTIEEVNWLQGTPLLQQQYLVLLTMLTAMLLPRPLPCYCHAHCHATAIPTAMLLPCSLQPLYNKPLCMWPIQPQCMASTGEGTWAALAKTIPPRGQLGSQGSRMQQCKLPPHWTQLHGSTLPLGPSGSESGGVWCRWLCEPFLLGAAAGQLCLSVYCSVSVCIANKNRMVCTTSMGFLMWLVVQNMGQSRNSPLTPEYLCKLEVW